MSNGDEVTRKSHIKRIYKNDDPDNGQWVDIERIDELRFVSKRQFPWREKRWTFDWDKFDPNGENVTKKKIKQHRDDSDDDAIEVPVRDMVFVTAGKEQQFQGYKHFFVNDDSNGTRETHSRRVYHHDISDEALDSNKNPPRDPSDYANAASSDKDKDQWLEVEMLDKYWTNEREARDAHGNLTVGSSGIWQEKKWLIDSKTDPLLFDESRDDPDFAPISNPDAGPQVDPPYRLDPLQNIVNVQWGGNVIVVFISSSPFLVQPEASYEMIEDKAKLLSTFRAKEESAQNPGYPCSAFKVSRNAKEFIKSEVPSLPSTEQPLGLALTVCIFAMKDDEETSLNRAIEGTKLIIPAMFNLSTVEPSDLPADMAPPGLLWLVGTGMMNTNQILTWKMRYGEHREKSEDESAEADKPPNLMVQCYHLESYTGPSGGVEVITWTGYNIFAYRLDKDGTKTVYGKLIAGGEEVNRQNIDAEWNKDIATPGAAHRQGIPSSDPPPLVSSDLETS